MYLMCSSFPLLLPVLFFLSRYQPGCDEDLSFQISRLKEESERRQALVEEETMHIELKLDQATKTLKTCQGQANGCEPSKEDALRLNQKHVRECVDVRRRHDHEIAWRMIYSCLWKHRALPLIHSIETWFTVPSVDMSSGCNKLRPLADPSVVDAKQCLCEEWDAVSKLEEKAKEAAQEVHAEEEVADATKAFQEKETEEKKKSNEEAQEKATEDIVYHELQKDGKLKSVLKEANEGEEGKSMVQKTLATAEHQVAKAVKKSKCKHDSGALGEPPIDCDEVAPGAGVDKSKLDYCMEMSDSDTVRTNIRKAFEVGNLKTGCALLSLATNSVLKGIHDCMCGGSSGGAAAKLKAQEDQDNGAAVNDVAHQLSSPTKTLSDVGTKRRFLRLKETSAHLVGQ